MKEGDIFMFGQYFDPFGHWRNIPETPENDGDEQEHDPIDAAMLQCVAAIIVMALCILIAVVIRLVVLIF